MGTSIPDYLSVASKEYTAQIYKEDGTIHNGPRTDYNPWTEPNIDTSATGPIFGYKAVQIGAWRIRQIDTTQSYLSISQKNGNVTFIFREDGNVHSKNNDFNGWQDEMGAPGCAYLSEMYLQIGEWPIGKFGLVHLSVSHRAGYTAQ
eukprot:8761110-Ditylum_brightwellii.AAC.1